MTICGAPGIYNDAPDMHVGTIEELRFCTLEPGHRGLHRDGGNRWGLLGELSYEEKLEALGITDEMA